MYDLNVAISWEAPSEPNGVILEYSYRLVATSDSGDVIIDDTNTTMLSAERSVMVSPFTSYTATVVAFTSAGGGESVMEVALSPEAGKFMCINNWTSLGLNLVYQARPSLNLTLLEGALID